jgi:hypothetical protein
MDDAFMASRQIIIETKKYIGWILKSLRMEDKREEYGYWIV